MSKHKHKGAMKLHDVERKHRDEETQKYHEAEINSKVGQQTAVKEAISTAQTELGTVPLQSTLSQVYGRAPRNIETYEPIVDFDPRNAPNEYIIVKMDHALLDDMLQKMSQKRAQAVGVPCRRV